MGIVPQLIGGTFFVSYFKAKDDRLVSLYYIRFILYFFA